MAQRFVSHLDDYLEASQPERLALLADVRGGWQN